MRIHWFLASVVCVAALSTGEAAAQTPTECILGNVHTTAGIDLDPSNSGISPQGDGILVRCSYFANGTLSLSGILTFRVACPPASRIVFPGYLHEPQFKEVASGASPNTVRINQSVVGISSVTLSDLTEVALVTVHNYNEIKDLALEVQAHCRTTAP